MLRRGSKRGGWITFPFITGAVGGLAMAGTGMMENVIVYLIREYNVKSIAAAQTGNIVNGCTSLFPLLAAILADSFFPSFTVVSFSASVSFLGTLVLTISAALKSLRPQPCEDDGSTSSCEPPSGLQYAVLYVGLALTAIGFGGTRFILATLGANQYDEPHHQRVFFNWFFFTMNVAAVVSMTAIFYVQGDVSWTLGFGLCAVANLIAMVILVFGYRFYRHDKPQGSPFVDLARVLVAAFRKCNISPLPSTVGDYYGGHEDTMPATRLRFFNRAALITEGDIETDGRIAKPWRLCTVQQVENFKTLIGILPLWSTSIFLSTPIGVLTSLSILQALTMDRHIGPHFLFPPASIPVAILISTSISLTLLDRLLYPAWQRLTGKSATALQRIAVGHVFNVVGMAVAAVVESERLSSKETMSAFWLSPQLILVGAGVAFHFPGLVGLYYQEFPDSLKSTSTAMLSLVIAIGNYLSTAVIDVVRRTTGWLPDDINKGRVDNTYWVLLVMGAINFAYYLVCATLYKYHKV